MEEGKMNEKQKEQLKVAARYGVCDSKYLGELIDQIRMAGVNKNGLRQMCYIIACNAQDSVESLFRDFINDDQYQRLFACIQAESGTDVFMEALEYAYRVYGSKSGRLPALDAGKQHTNWEHIAAVVADNRLSCQDMIELVEIFPDFAAVFQEAFEAFVESMNVWSPEDLEKAQRILGLLAKGLLRTKNRKILDMRLLQEKNVTDQSDGARRLRKYFSLRQIRYLNAKWADRARLSDAILQKIDASFVRNLICSGDDEAAPYAEAEKELFLQLCDRELKPRINGYSKMRDFVQTIQTDRYEQPKLTEENWMFLYQKMVCETYKKGFMSFLGILKFDCLATENRNRWLAVTEHDRYELLQAAIYDASSKADEKSGRKAEVLKAALSLIIWTMQQNGVEVNEETKLKACIQYAGPDTPAFIQAGLVRYETEAFEDFWRCAQSLSRLDNWTLRVLLKRYQETSRTLPDDVFTEYPAEFFAAICNNKKEPLTKTERMGLFELYADSVYQNQPLNLLKLYEHMLKNDIAFADYMSTETAKDLAETLLRQDVFPVQKNAVLKNLLSKQEFTDYLNKEEEIKTIAKELEELQDLQRETEKAVMKLLTNPKAFFTHYDYVYRRGGRDITILKILENTNIRMTGNSGILDETLYQSMRLHGCNVFEYADSMTSIAKACKDSYFLQILAKRIQQMTDAEWRAVDDAETERS